jgi:glycosyltransferase involved in cell wall biosynthesis
MPEARTVEVLISCMHQTDMSLARLTNVSSAAVIVNQCDTNAYGEAGIEGHRVRMCSSTDRGLSRSRNQAIEMSAADICLLCDDDERLEDDYVARIVEAYEAHPDADVIAFRVRYPSKQFWKTAKRVGRLDALKIFSCQITFKRQSIVDNAIAFNEQFGAGTRYPFGEDNIFLYDCLRAGLRIYYVPSLIAVVAQDTSTWFHGFTEEYFTHRGIITRYYMGVVPATLYACYFAAAKFPVYRKEISFFRALKKTLNGICRRKIDRPQEP